MVVTRSKTNDNNQSSKKTETSANNNKYVSCKLNRETKQILSKHKIDNMFSKKGLENAIKWADDYLEMNSYSLINHYESDLLRLYKRWIEETDSNLIEIYKKDFNNFVDFMKKDNNINFNLDDISKLYYSTYKKDIVYILERLDYEDGSWDSIKYVKGGKIDKRRNQ